MATKTLPGYSTSWGNKNAAVLESYGPKSYVAGGYKLTAAELGWGGLDFAAPMNFGAAALGGAVANVVPLSVSGTYYVTVVLATTAVNAAPYVTIQWFVAASGAEVTTVSNTNLSAERVRLLVVGV